ncbi:MAG: GxxExxY protein [Thermodesulfobacteriota bacterium]
MADRDNLAASRLYHWRFDQIRQMGCIIINEHIDLNLDTMEIVHKDLSYKITGLAMDVHSRLGYGFLEKVYENALLVLLRREGIDARQQHPVKVHFENEIVGGICS